MNEPNLDDLSVLIPSKFSLVTLAMKRARQLKAGSRPLIDTYSQKPVTIALQEILSDRVRLGPQAPADELEKEEQEAMLRAIGLSEPTSVSVARRMEEIYGRDEEAEGEFEEYDEEYEEEEEREEEEEEESLTDKDTIESEEEEEEEESLVSAARRGSDFLHEDPEEARQGIEEEALELEIDDEDSDEESDEDESAEEVAEAPSTEASEEEQPKAAKGRAKAAPKAEKPAAKAPAKKARKAEDEEEQPAAKKTARKPKA
jgi:DNA-directed RNA polymerase omega subunit